MTTPQKPRKHRPIKVSPSPISEQAWVAVRKIAPAIVMFALAKGWLSDDLSTLLGIVGGIIWPIGYGQIATWRNHAVLTDLAHDPAIPQVEFASKIGHSNSLVSLALLLPLLPAAIIASIAPVHAQAVSGLGIKAPSGFLPSTAIYCDNGSTVAVSCDFATTKTDAVTDALTTTASVTSASVLISVPTTGFEGGSFHVTSPGTGSTITYEQSGDNVNWLPMPVSNDTVVLQNGVLTSATAGVFGFTSSSGYVRARVSTYGSGTITASLVQKRLSPSRQNGSNVLLASSSNIGNVNTNIGYTDSTTALASSATFIGTGRANSASAQYSYFNVTAWADQAGTVSIEQSVDTGATYRTILSAAVTAGSGQVLRMPLTGLFSTATLYRVRYVNGATAQGAFSISSSFTAF